MKHCMIVERSSVVRKVASRILQDAAASVVEAENIREALEKCAVTMPETIIIDAGLPDNGAIEMITAIRQDTSVEQPTILVLLSELNLVTMTKTKRAGANDFLLKPFDREQFMSNFAKAKRQAA